MKSTHKLNVLQKIDEYEKAGLWNKDVEDDPETIVLMPDKVDYLGEKLSTRVFTKIANRVAINFYEKQIKSGDFIIKSIHGLENFTAETGGAILTCNHFSVYDNYAVYRAIRENLPKGHQLYKVIREGNYTNFKGLFGFFFRHCNTLPLSSNVDTMKKFMKSVSTLLKRGEKILIYPEQAMWWNYRKPRPMQNGAFKLAVKNSVPIIPVFITMEDTDKLDADGFNIQAYTIWILPAIRQKTQLNSAENVEYLREENYKVWKKVYEDFYKEELSY